MDGAAAHRAPALSIRYPAAQAIGRFGGLWGPFRPHLWLGRPGAGLPGFIKPGAELQRQALEDVTTGLSGGGGAPVEQDLGDDGVHHGLAAAEPVLGADVLLQVASLPRASGARPA